MELSICIPTYNRPEFLYKCLESIKFSSSKSDIKLEVCIADNNSRENILDIINKFKHHLKIKFYKQEENLGFALNYIHCLKMASGEFIWTLGDDDIILPNSLETIKKILENHKDIDFIYVNSIPYESKKYSFKNLYENQLNIQKVNLKSKKMKFLSLLDPKIIRDDFFQGMFLASFRRSKMVDFKKFTDEKLIKDKGVWSNYDNTCLHIKMYAESFNNSMAYFQADYLSLNLYGHKDWNAMVPFIYIIRIPENIDYFRKKGLSLLQYLKCKNFAVRNLFSYVFFIYKNPKISGAEQVNFFKHILKNLFFPSVYIMIIKKFLNINIRK